MPEDDLIVDTDNLVAMARRWDTLAARYRSDKEALPAIKTSEFFGDLSMLGGHMGREFMEVWGQSADGFKEMCDAMYELLSQVGRGVMSMARIFQAADDASADASQGLLNNFANSTPPYGADVASPPNAGSGGADRH